MGWLFHRWRNRWSELFDSFPQGDVREAAELRLKSGIVWPESTRCFNHIKTKNTGYDSWMRLSPVTRRSTVTGGSPGQSAEGALRGTEVNKVSTAPVFQYEQLGWWPVCREVQKVSPGHRRVTVVTALRIKASDPCLKASQWKGRTVQFAQVREYVT